MLGPLTFYVHLCILLERTFIPSLTSSHLNTIPPSCTWTFPLCNQGLTENHGPSKLQDTKLMDHVQGVKLQDVKMTDQFAGHEIAGHENAGHENDGRA